MIGLRRTSWLYAIIVAIAVVSSIAADDVEHLSVANTAGRRGVVVPSSGTPYLTQAGRVYLQKGDNYISFDTAKLNVPVDKLRLSFPDAKARIQVVNVAVSPDNPDTAIWQVQAPTACHTSVRIASPLKGLKRRYKYRLELDTDERALDLSASLSITNDSKLQLDDAQLHLPAKGTITQTLNTGERRNIPLFAYNRIPYQTLFIYDTQRYGSEAKTVIRLARSGYDKFSQRALMAGVVEIYAKTSPGLYIAKRRLSYVPSNETVDVVIGNAPAISVERKLVEAKEVTAKEDVTGEVSLFHEDDEVEFEITNGRNTPVTLHLRDTIDGHWEMLKNSEPFERIDADTVEFVIELEADGTQKVTYTARRKNIEP